MVLVINVDRSVDFVVDDGESSFVGANDGDGVSGE